MEYRLKMADGANEEYLKWMVKGEMALGSSRLLQVICVVHSRTTVWCFIVSI